MQFSIAVPPGNLRGPEYTEQLLAALHSACPRKWGFELHLRPLGATVGQACRLPSEVVPVFTERVADAYPDATIAPIPAAEEPSGTERRVWRQELWLSPDLGMVKTFRHFADPLRRTVADPIAGVLSALRRRDDGVEASVVIHLRPGAAWRIYIAQFQWRILSIVLQTSWPAPAWFAASLCRHYRYVVRFIGNALLAGAYASARAATVAPSPKLTGPLFEARVVLKASAPRELRPKAVERLRELRSAFSPFRGEAAFQALRVRGRRRLFRTRFLLSAEEAATLWHPPTETVRVAEMARADYRQLEPPADLPTPESHEELAVLGTVDFRRHQNQCGLLPDDRRRHLAVVGKTGMGKTTLLQSLLENDITAGRGAGLIDPHGDLAESLLARIPRHRTNDVVYFDAGDRDRPVAYNPLTARDRLERPLVASGVVSAFKKLYGDSWGPRLEYIFRNALLTLLDMPQASLAALPRLLTDKSWRTQALTHVEDDVIRSFWLHEFQAWKPQFQAEACAPILNKVGQFLAHPILRAILTPERSALDLSRVLDRSGILVANLSKGRIGEDGSNLLGSLLITGLQIAAMRRADRPEAERRDFFLFVDEFQNFATDSFATILSEARKYRLNLTIANQYLEQVPEQTLAAVFGNVGSLLCFQVGARDAESLAEQLGADVEPQQLTNLPRHVAYARLLIDGLPSRPFSLRTLPPSPVRDSARGDVIRRTSRHRYGRSVSPAGVA